MEEHKYVLLKGRWGISITIFGQIFDKTIYKGESIAVDKGVFLSFSKEPIIKNEVFCEEDRESIYKAIKMVGNEIEKNNPFSHNVVIQICSLQYSLCYYQEEAMIIAMIYWCSKVFGFRLKEIGSKFDYLNNRYIFDFKEYGV